MSIPCIVLVPFTHSIDAMCEQGLHALERAGYTVRRVQGFSAIDFGRSALASDALREGFEEIMWIDSDIGFHPADVERLRSHGLPISCGLYPKKRKKEFACVFLPGERQMTFGADGGLHEVKYAGFGFVHTRRAVYEEVRRRFEMPDCNGRFGPPITPYFLPMIVPDETQAWYLSEDYAFCERVRACNFHILADTTLKLTHFGSHGYTWDDIK